MKHTALIAVLFTPLSAFAQVPPVAGKPAIETSIAGVPYGKKLIPVEASHRHTVSAWVDINRDNGRLEGVYSDCDDTIDDCRFALFDFPQVRQYWGGSLLYNDQPIGGIENQFGVKLINGYRVGFSRRENGSSYSVALAIEKPATNLPLSFYKGQLTVGSETREVCFSLSPEKIDQWAGDPDMSQGVFVSQAIPEFNEGGKKCATALEYNGSYIRSCSGLFLTEATTLKDGPIFDDLSRFDPNTGALARKPVGSYSFKPVASCPR